jgi:hypothetical protein
MAQIMLFRLITVKTLVRVAFAVLGLSTMAHADWANATGARGAAGSQNFMEGGGG